MDKINIPRQLLYDGEEAGVQKTLLVDLQSHQFTVNPYKLSDFRDLTASIDNESFTEIVANVDFLDLNGVPVYSINGLSVYYHIENNFIVIFSFGEFQPQRYKLYFESLWRF